MIGAQLPRLGTALLAGFGVLAVALAWWQVPAASGLEARADNPALIAAHRSQPRGSIFDTNGALLASTQVHDGLARRTYASPSSTHVIGYASSEYGTSGIERAWDEFLVGLRDPNPLHDILSDVLQGPPQPSDLVLTFDARLQAYAAAQLGGQMGAVVAIDPASGAVLAMTSSPTFDASALSGDPAAAQTAWNALAADPSDPFVDRSRHGVYVPGSVMKVVTAALALDGGFISPDTTFPTQPQEEMDGLLVNGFRITEHDLGGVTPALWNLSEATQISSNIYFAHVGLEVGQDAYLAGVAPFAFCDDGLRVGPVGHALAVSPSSITPLLDTGCEAFVDDAELASAAFGQARVTATPLQMALVAATIANDGVMRFPFVVREVRSPDPAGGSSQVTASFESPGRRTVVSPQTADEVRQVMVDAVHGPLGVPYAGAANVARYGISGVATAGKTGTAQRGGDLPPHSWFIGFVPAQSGGRPAIAVAVIVEGGGSGSASAAPIGGRIMAEWQRLTAG